MSEQPAANRAPASREVVSDFSCVCSRSESASRVTVGGELDIATVPRLDHALRDIEGDSALVVVDLRELEFMDCSAAQLILLADRRIRRAGGRMVVVRGSAFVDWFLALINMDRLLELVDPPRPHDAFAPAMGGALSVLAIDLVAPRTAVAAGASPT